ncbi:MAG: hypothetical protein L0196_03495 [candidate division Zixibacteria bacterium]|nr:hypothetical protein [candidate division Zixibacteria bacterium]
MLKKSKQNASWLALAIALVLIPFIPDLNAQELPSYLRDRGTGVPSSMFGTYLQKGELRVYPYFEWYADSDLEYKPSELGYWLEVDYRGRYRASEWLLFLGYGLTSDLVLEFEAAAISAELEKSSNDTSAMPQDVEESGLGDVEAQLRWRFLRENQSRPEVFTYFETVFPLQKTRRLIGTSDWEFKLGFGAVRGFGWGTMTLRLAVDYTRAERKFEAGSYALEYLKRLSPAWRAVALIEGNQFDEVELITEMQWYINPRTYLKFNNGWGLTTNATDFAPEVGLMFSF